MLSAHAATIGLSVPNSGGPGGKASSVPLVVDPTSRPATESLEEFKNSFSYGSRSDLSFKFLKNLSPEEAGEFFRQLLWEVGDSLDHGHVEPIHQLIFEWQLRAYEGSGRLHTYDEAPFTVPTKPVAASRIGVLTSSGHFAAGDDPRPFGLEAMTQADAEARIGEFLRDTPVLSAVPTDINADELLVRHGGYDVRSVSHDPEVAFPLQTMAALDADGVIGELSSPLYSFTGATSQGRLRKQALPGWIDRIAGDGIDVLLLVPV